jgi:hypothetical protein
VPSIEVVPPFKVVLTPVEVQTFDVTVSAPNPVVQVVSEGPQGPGVPRGGVEFDLLEKAGPDDFDTRFTSTPTVRRVSFSTSDAGELDAPGDLAWDDLDQALAYRTNGIMVDIAQENLIYVRNGPEQAAITKGMAVSFAGASANRIDVRPCVANLAGVGCATAGVALTDIPSPGFGFVSTFGLVRGFNTDNILTDGGPPVTEGQELFISTTPGVVATFPAVSPARRVTVGYVVTTGQNGSVFVTVRRGLTVNELDNVIAPSPSNGQALVFDATAGVWQPGAVDAVTSVNGETGDVVLDAADVGAYADDNPSGFVDAAGAAAAAPVQSVNSLSGTVVLDAAAVGAYPDSNPSGFVDAAGAAVAAPVQSVNGATGAVSVNAVGSAAAPITYDVGTQTVGSDGSLLVTVEHGGDDSEPRPSYAATVYWKGTVAPVNGAAGDVWFDTTGES